VPKSSISVLVAALAQPSLRQIQRRRDRLNAATSRGALLGCGIGRGVTHHRSDLCRSRFSRVDDPRQTAEVRPIDVVKEDVPVKAAVGEPAERRGPRAAAGQHAGQQHGQQQRAGETIGQETAEHAWHRQRGTRIATVQSWQINPASCAPAPSSPLAAATTEAQRPLSLPLSDVAGLLPPHSRTLYITGRTGGAPSVARITPLLSTM